MRARKIFDENLYGWRYIGSGGRSAEAIRCYAGQWMTCYYRNGNQIYFGKTVPDVSPQLAKSHALKFATSGELPSGLVELGTVI
jgi:hypothetical protein